MSALYVAERGVSLTRDAVIALRGGASTLRFPVVAARGPQAQWLTPEAINSSPQPIVGYSHRGGLGVQLTNLRGGPLAWVKSPYGEPGDTLWVRERWAEYEVDDVQGSRLYYEADYPDGKAQVRPGWFLVWKSAASMPRAASRFVLRVTAIDVERLAEGAPWEWVVSFKLLAEKELYAALCDHGAKEAAAVADCLPAGMESLRTAAEAQAAMAKSIASEIRRLPPASTVSEWFPEPNGDGLWWLRRRPGDLSLVSIAHTGEMSVIWGSVFRGHAEDRTGWAWQRLRFPVE